MAQPEQVCARAWQVTTSDDRASNAKQMVWGGWVRPQGAIAGSGASFPPSGGSLPLTQHSNFLKRFP